MDALAVDIMEPKISPKKRASDNQKKVTLADYMALPEGTRMELIDGVLYDMAKESVAHNRIKNESCSKIAGFIEKNEDNGEVFISGLDVILFEDRDTVVQPDVFVVCNPDKIGEQGVNGAPDWIIEIASPSNYRHDYLRKLNLYMEAGVREYWIINPMEQNISVYIIENMDFELHFYGFREDVPVQIYDGRLKLNFSRFAE